MKAIALDIGERRIGVAKTDALNITAQGLTTVTVRFNREKTVREVAELLEKEGADVLVVGLPRNMNGTEGPAAEGIRTFVEELMEHIDLPVEYVDERLTTVSAQRVLLEGDVSRKKRKGVVDMMAATIILQTWMDGKR